MSVFYARRKIPIDAVVYKKKKTVASLFYKFQRKSNNKKKRFK